jgi:hypothetical protein
MADLNVLYRVTSQPSTLGARSTALLSSPARQCGSSFRKHIYLKTAPFWDIMQLVVVTSYRRFGTAYRPNRSRTSVINYQYSLRNTPEECSSHLLRGGSLKSRIAHLLVGDVIRDRPIPCPKQKLSCPRLQGIWENG